MKKTEWPDTISSSASYEDLFTIPFNALRIVSGKYAGNWAVPDRSHPGLYKLLYPCDNGGVS